MSPLLGVQDAPFHPGMRLKDLKTNLNADFSSLPPQRLAVLGDSATQFLVKAIRAYGYDAKIDFRIFEADFDQTDRQILDPASELYESNPEFIVIYPSAEKLWASFCQVTPQVKADFGVKILSEIEHWWQTIAKLSNARVIHFNFVETSDPVFGHFGTKTKASFLYQVRKINFELMKLAQETKHVFIADVAALSAEVGYKNTHDPRLYATSKVAFTLDFLPVVAKAVTDIVASVNGRIKKCLVLDLDNTIWGGVIGDDGVENIEIGELGMGHAYDAVQRWAKELKNRGILLAVCSKNDESAAKQPFREHPDMILKLEDIAVFVANWDNKVDGIKNIQRVLNVGFDSMVYLDDNPFERNMIRQLLPEVTVPELPEDPALYVSYLCSLNLFETASFSEEDLERTKQYQAENVRSDFQKSFTSVEDYLRSLQMVAVVGAFDDFSVPRVAQLTQRSNQFNLRTIRYSEADINHIRKSEEFITLSFRLRDKFGDHGLIGLIILRRMQNGDGFIDTWIMSCRVLKRGMEEFIVNEMADTARQRGIERLIGEYLPSSKNNIVKDLYPRMGFTQRDNHWELNLNEFTSLDTFIGKEYS